MALIGWKQLGRDIGDYGSFTGSLDISGSLTVNGLVLGDLGDITSITAGDGLSGGGSIGEVSLALDTGSAHFLNALTKINNAGIFKQTGSFWSTTNDVVISGSLKVSGSVIFTGNGGGITIDEPLVFTDTLITPTASGGGILYSGSNFYFGID